MNPIRLRAAVAITLALGGFTAADLTAAQPMSGPAVPGFEAYDQLVPALLEKWDVPGASVAIAYRGRIVFARGYGFADLEAARPVQPDTRFRVCSTSKAITAAAVLKLIDEGRLSLDDRAFPLLGYPTPPYPGAVRDPRLDQITVRQLLSHTGGWLASQAEIPFSGGVRGFDPVFAQREIAQFLGLPPPPSAEVLVRVAVGLPLQAAPGTAYEYCNLDCLTLGRIIELKTGLTYEAAVQQMLGACGISGLRTGGSRRTELAADEAVYYDYPGAPLLPSHLDDGLVAQPYMWSLPSWDASGGWVMSAIEYVRFLLALEGQGSTPRLLQPASAAAMRTEQFPGSAYGYGWVTNYQPYGDDSGHSGGLPGSRSLVLRSPDGEWLRVALFNSRPADFEGFETDIYAMLHAVSELPTPPEHDFTRNTLGWEAWQHARLAGCDAGALADPDGDDVPNLLEYAAGLDPTRADGFSPASFTRLPDGTPALVYRRLPLGHALTWQVEVRSATGVWQVVNATAQGTVLNEDGTITETVALPGAIQARLRVGQPGSVATATLDLAVPPPAIPMTGPAVPGFEAYDQIIPTLLEQAHIPGAAVAVAYRGRIVFARGYGYADRDTERAVQPDTRFRIGSVSKPITAALVLKLIEEGRLSLDTQAFPTLGYPTPSYAGARRDSRLDRITVRQLLSHTGGWDGTVAHNPLVPNQIGFYADQWQADVAGVMHTAAPPSAETIVRFVVGQPLQAEPGTSWHYSNIGFLTLGRLIEQKTGLGYEEAVRQFVGKSYVSGLAISGSRQSELGNDEAVYYDYPGAPLMPLYLGAGNERVPQPYMWSFPSYDASGGWSMSAIEVLRFLLALEGRNGTPPLLQPASLAAMRTAVPQSTTFYPYGFGWFTANANNTNPPGNDSGHGGGTWGTAAWALRSSDGEWHIAALLNGSVNLANTSEVNQLNTQATAVLHALPDFSATPPDHDLTWSTLGWEAWQHARLAGHDAGALADPDEDGVSNLIEYATALDPTRADATPPASLAFLPDGSPAVTYRRLILEHAITTRIETSPDGHTWTIATAAPRQTTLNSDGTLTVTVPTPGATHARLRVSLPDTDITCAYALTAGTPAGTRLVNVSTRARAGSGDNTLIVGFTIEGTTPRTVLVRGVGPALAQFGVPHVLSNPGLRLFSATGREVTCNDNWCANATALTAAGDATGAFDLGADSNDAALLVTLNPGLYTAHVTSTENAEGTALVEVYEADAGASRLVNLSTRGRIGGDAGEMIAGFVVQGSVPRRVLLRAIGPELRSFHVADALTDPVLTVMRGQTRIAQNAGWSSGSADETAALVDAMARAGAFALPSGSADAAIALVLPPGLYTMIVTPAGTDTGVVLAEVYDVP